MSVILCIDGGNFYSICKIYVFLAMQKPDDRDFADVSSPNALYLTNCFSIEKIILSR